MKIKVYCIDAVEGMKKLPDNSIDLIIADPPYCSDIEWDRATPEWHFKWLREGKRVLKDGGALYVFFAPLNMYEVEGFIRREFNLRNILVWHHPNLYGAGMSYGRDRYKSTWDVVFYAIKGEKARIENVGYRAYKFGSGFDVIISPQPRPLLHKAQKPLKVIMKFIYSSSNEGDLVLDPFLGSGTTAVACKMLNRNFIGFDIKQEYVELTKRRLKNTPSSLKAVFG